MAERKAIRANTAQSWWSNEITWRHEATLTHKEGRYLRHRTRVYFVPILFTRSIAQTFSHLNFEIKVIIDQQTKK